MGSTLSAFKTGVYVFALLACLSAPSVVLADDRTEAQAARAMADGKWEQARALTQASGEKDLGQFYEWMLYRKGTVLGLPFDRIVRFIELHPDWPSQKAMQATAERNMPESYSPVSVMQWFSDHPPVTGAGILKMVSAARQTGQMAMAKTLFQSAWPEADVSDEDQAAILSSCAPLLSRDLNRRRIDDLLDKGRYTLARALAGRMGNGYPELVEARIALREEKPGIPGLIARVPANLTTDPGLLFERLRWRRKHDDDAGALAILKSAPPSVQITNPDGWWKERNIIARRMIEEKNYRQAYALASAHETQEGSEYADAEWLSGWLALRFLKNPDQAFQHFQSMYGEVKSAVSKSRGAYWSARALEAKGDKVHADEWYRTSAGYPKTYYGQIALLHLKMPTPVLSPAMPTAEERRAVERSSLVAAIRIASLANLRQERIELVNAMMARLKTAGDYAALSLYLKTLGLQSDSFRVAKKAAGENYFLGDQAYPSLEGQMRGLDVDKALVHAVIRQESQFDPEVRSPAGAIGLMQLMPSTADHVARKRGWDNRTEWLSSQPTHNIRLGSAYLNDLIARFGGAYPLAIAAYNAGPSRVSQWLEEFGDPRTGQVDWIDWIELIPISETRNYVQRVMEGYVVYREHMGIQAAAAN